MRRVDSALLIAFQPHHEEETDAHASLVHSVDLRGSPQLRLPAQNIAVLADHLYTMADGTQGGPGMVLIRDGKIEAVRPGPHQSSPDGYTLLKAAFVTPGLD